MGISIGNAKGYNKEAKRVPFKGLSILSLGRMDIYFTYENLKKIAKEYDFKLFPFNITLHQQPAYKAMGYMSDDSFLGSLGCSEYKSLDFSNYESVDYIFDLNNPDVPKELIERFDIILDSGTIEHVFHIPNVLNNLFKMLKIDGRIIHMSPSSNNIDHGFYMFSPTLFSDYYEANKFDINTLQLVRFYPYERFLPWKVSNYTPGCLDGYSLTGLLKDGIYLIICIVTKKRESTGNLIPQQGSCLISWGIKQQKKNEHAVVKHKITLRHLIGVSFAKIRCHYGHTLIYLRVLFPIFQTVKRIAKRDFMHEY